MKIYEKYLRSEHNIFRVITILILLSLYIITDQNIKNIITISYIIYATTSLIIFSMYKKK